MITTHTCDIVFKNQVLPVMCQSDWLRMRFSEVMWECWQILILVDKELTYKPCYSNNLGGGVEFFGQMLVFLIP